MRRSVPNWLISSGSDDPRTLRKSSAGPAGLDDAVGDLADLEVRIDLGRDLDQLSLAPEQVDPLAQVVADHVREASGCPREGHAVTP